MLSWLWKTWETQTARCSCLCTASRHGVGSGTPPSAPPSPTTSDASLWTCLGVGTAAKPTTPTPSPPSLQRSSPLRTHWEWRRSPSLAMHSVVRVCPSHRCVRAHPSPDERCVVPVCCMWPLGQALWVSRWQRVSMPAALIRSCWWRHCHQVGSLTSASRQPTALLRPWSVAVRSLRTAHARWHVRTTKVPCSAWRSSTRRRS